MTKIYNYTKKEWDVLVTNVRNGETVPIIGSEALELYFEDGFDINEALKFNPTNENTPLLIWESKLLDKLRTGFDKTKRGFLLYDYLIYKLLSYCFQADLENNFDTDKIDLAKAAFIFLLNIDKDLRKKAKLRAFIKKEIGFLKSKVSSTSLDVLTQIPYFKLYISLIIDDFLDHSLENTFYLGRPEFNDNIKFADARSKQDFTDNKFTESAPRLYHTYGSLNDTTPYFAITEEEIIEFTCTIGVSNTKPENLISYVQNKSLLLIGCRYNDWLLGFLLRMLTGSRIYDNQATKIFTDRSFTHCQTYLTEDYEIYVDNIDAIEFITKLQKDCAPSQSKKIEKGGVFISFHSGDRVCANKLKNYLVNKGIPTWFDEDGLDSGAIITPKIQDNIINSSVFIALISNHNKAEPDKYFMKEWEYVKKVKNEHQRDKVVIPLIIEETIPFNDLFVMEHFPDIKNRTLHVFKYKNDSQEDVCRIDEDDDNLKKLVFELKSSVRKFREKTFSYEYQK